MTDCDLHPATHNLLYACKELVPNYVLLYKKVFDLAMLYNQQENVNAPSISVPNDLENIVCNLLENLMVALEVLHLYFPLMRMISLSRLEQTYSKTAQPKHLGEVW